MDATLENTEDENDESLGNEISEDNTELYNEYLDAVNQYIDATSAEQKTEEVKEYTLTQ